MIRDIIGLILSIFVAGAMIWACSFEIQHLIIGELVTYSGGKYKFLTIINIHIQAIYFCLCIINFFFGSNTLVKEKRSLLQKLRDCLYAGIAFPMGLFVSITFWGLYNLDRKLIYPEELDQFISPILNHVLHTLPAIAVCLENLVHNHHYPSRVLGLSCNVIVCVAYAAWIHYLNYIHWVEFKRSLWVYPILDELSFIYRELFLLGLILFNVGLYFIGEMYTLFLTNLQTEKNMPVQKIAYAHRFGIISTSYKEKIEKDIRQRQQQESDRSSSAYSGEHGKKYLILEVTEEFVRDYNRASSSERIKLNELIYRMLQRLKRKAAQCQVHTNRPIQLQMAWAELCLLSQCKSCYQEECLTTLYRALIYSPLSATQIPTLFFLSETILYWLKNDAILEPFLTSTELKLLKIGQIVFQLLYFHYLEGSTGPYEEFKIRLHTYLEGLDECESAYSSYPNAVWCIHYIESIGSILVASVDKNVLNSRRSISSAATHPAPPIPSEDYHEINKSELSAVVQELSPIIWHSVDVWLFVKKYSTNNLSEIMNHYFNETILSLIACRHKLIDENWIDVVLALQILSDVAKTNMDMLETIQLLAQPESTAQLPLHKRADSHLLSRGWRSWSWQLIILLCECLTSICIGTNQTIIKRTVLFGNETSSDNILIYASDNQHPINEQKTFTESSTSRGNDDNVCLMHMMHYRTIDEQGKIKTDNDDDDDNNQSWRIRYMGLLCMSQIYKHLQNEPRHKTLSNLLWMFIHEYEKREKDDRILEALKVGRFDDDIIQTLKTDIIDNQLGTIYNSMAQRLADGLLPDPTPSELRSAKVKFNKKPSFKKSQYVTTSQSRDRYHLSIPSVPPSRDEKKPIQIKRIIENNINDVFKRKEHILQNIVVDQYRKELEEKKDETIDVIEQLDSMVERAMETTTLNENSLSSVFTLSNKKFIVDPLQERRALIESMGLKLIINKSDEQE
ncbi:unnamed protein product [Rotaria sordida]|uniref:Uncharacterized protein n=1 Tax=Rotaria sordida TaxID=392033 RepID=A0A814QTP8_9BILA|nr:unnamed protein product [Rotaria sordida]